MRSPALRRTRRNYKHRPTAFVAWADTIGAQLGQVDPDTERLYLVGKRPGESRSGLLTWASGDLPEGWRHDSGGHYLEGASPVLRYRRPDGRTLEVHRAASWFGEGASVEDCRAAWQVLGARVRAGFDEGQVLANPASTGRYLLARSVPFGTEWPTLPEDLQHLIRSTSGQGRIEWIGTDADTVPAVVEVDSRFAYAAACWGLGAGVPTVDDVAEYAGYQRGRYLVDWSAPAGWNGPGLLGVHDGGDGWCWPTEGTGSGWYDGQEVGLALSQGWRLTIRQRLLFPAYKGKGPMDTWAERLVAIRGDVLADDSLPGGVREALAAAFRAILLHTIGALHGRGHRITRVAEADEDVPRGAQGWRMEGDRHVWTEDSGQAWPEMAHPEWSAAIWARTRSRLLDAPTGTRCVRAGALHLPEGVRVLAMRTDALWLDGVPAWATAEHDDGRPGRYRVKSHHEGPMAAPQSHRDLLRMKGGQ